jgi:uncharacterized membrane protein
MKLLELLFRPETRLPVAALALATATGTVLMIVEILFSLNIRYGLLLYNLLLAWIPLILALLAQREFELRGWRHWKFLAPAVGWLLFFPNASYIFTDVVHVFRGSFRFFWADLTLIFIFGLTGLVLGFLSLHVMHSLANREWGGRRGWLFVSAVCALGGFGIYLGRVLRFNSWDALLQPVKIIEGVRIWAGSALGDPSASMFPAFYAAFLFLAYLMLHALTHLPQLEARGMA